MRRLRRLYERLILKHTRRLFPGLDHALAEGPQTIRRMTEDNLFLRQALHEEDRAQLSRVLAIQQDYREAIFIAGGGWLKPLRAHESDIAPRYEITIRESDNKGIVQCKERLLELELALEDRSWKRLEAQARFEFSRWGIQQIILITRLYRIKNPVIQRGILLSTYYVWGRGVKIGADDETANQIIADCFTDPRNATELSHAALCAKNEAKYTDGNIFWCWFVDPEDGQTIFRHIDPMEVQDIISDPDDASQIWYYRRVWTQQVFDPNSGTIKPQPRDEWYVAYGYEPPDGAQQQIKGKPLVKDTQGNLIPIYHRCEGGLENWQFGCPRAYAALDWARAWVESLEDYCSRVRALSRYGYDIETKGGPPAIAGMKQQLATTLANDLESIETQPPPVTAALWVHGPGTQMKPMRTAGLSEVPSQGYQILHMAQMVFGLPDTMFSDSQRGNLATAASLDRPTELKFLYDQEIWKQDLGVLSKVALENSLHANGGRLRESLKARGIEPKDVVIEIPAIDAKFAISSPTRLREASRFSSTAAGEKAGNKIKIKVEFPAILEGDIPQRVSAIVEAMSLGNTQGIVVGIDEKVGVELLLNQLLSFGFEFDPDAIIESMYPSKGKDKYDPLRKPEDQPLPGAAPAAAPAAAAPKPAQKQAAAQESFRAAVSKLTEIIESQRERVEAKRRAA